MAIGRLSVKVGKVGKAGPHAAYIAREGQYADRLKKGEKLEATEAGNMPAWAQHEPQLFWQAADQFERKNGAAYREFEVALPRELNPEQRLALVREFVAAEIGTRHAYQFAIHTPRAMDGDEQPHAHIMFSERQIDGIDRDPAQYFKRYNGNNPALGGARKSFAPLESDCDMSTRRGEREAERAQLLQQLRARWEQTCNRHLEMAGEQARIDMRSYRDQGIDRTPEPKLLPSETRQPGRRAQVLEFRAEQRAADARSELRAAVPDAGAEIINLAERRAQREREQQLISDAIAARDALYERYRAGPDSQKEIDMADAYGLRYNPRTTAEAERLQQQVDSRMRQLDEIEAKRAAEAAAPKPTLAELIQQPQARQEPVPKVDTPRQGTDLGQLLAQGERVTAPPSPPPVPEQAPGLTLEQHQVEIDRRIKERTVAIGLKREDKATAPARERLQGAQERLKAALPRIESADRQAFSDASRERTAQRTAEREADRLAGEAEQWRATHWMQTKLGRTGPADDLDRQAEQHRRQAQEHARKADEAEARREALAREARQLEREVGVAEKGVETARQEARRKDQGLDGYTAARQVIDEYRREHPDYAQKIDQHHAEERERKAAEEAQREAQQQALEQSQDMGRSR